jgi:hypothetical protein
MNINNRFGSDSIYGLEELSNLLKKFANNDIDLEPFEWDDFECGNLKDPYEIFVQKLVFFIGYTNSANSETEWCNTEGVFALLRLAKAIELDSIPFPPKEVELKDFDNKIIPERYRGILKGY